MSILQPEESSFDRGVFVGPYQVIRPLGQGGMGDVQLAKRSDGQYSKLVALKRLRGNGEKLRERFRSERQILAQLNHPNIAALLDGGETPAGELYVVMEYVDGEPLIAYANRKNLGIEARLGLFLQICAAVQHAHQNLIVHRDLKPSNILVTSEGAVGSGAANTGAAGGGSVKLIDFGIAKALFPDDREMAAPETQTGQALLTPLYASPEQVRGERVSMASDVYALGVVLFELLAGALPYPDGASGPALAEAICTRDPRSLTATAAGNGRAAWRAELAGDLETIVAMALRKEPARRYHSVEQFAADIERHLHGFPVSARPDTAMYRASRFVGRNRAMVAAGAVATALLVASSIINYRTARQAEQERNTAQVVASFMESIFAAPDPNNSFAKDVTAKELLARGEARIGAELKTKPEIEARLLVIMGRTQKELGDAERAIALYDRALSLNKQVFGQNHPAVAETLVEKSRAMEATGHYGAAESLLREALQIQRQTLPADGREILYTVSLLALATQRKGRFEEGIELLPKSIEAFERRWGSNVLHTEPYYRQALNVQALLLTDLGRLDDTEAVRRKLAEVDLRLRGERSIDYVQDLATLGTSLRERGAYEEAEPLLRRAYELQRMAVEPGSPNVLHTMQYLAICLQSMGRLDEAETLWNQLRPQRLKLLGDTDRFVATDWVWWGDFLRRKGDLAGAEAAIRRGAAIRVAVLKPAHRAHAQSSGMLGMVLEDKGDWPNAEVAFRAAYNLTRSIHGDQNPRTTAQESLRLGRVLWRLGRLDEAEKLLRQSYTARGTLPSGDVQLTESALQLGQFLTATGRAAEGQKLISQATAAQANRRNVPQAAALTRAPR